MSIPNFRGDTFQPGQENYDVHVYQYAYSSHREDHDMNPGLIIFPKDIQDIQTAVTFAASRQISIACRTGGHQYSGASSTSGKNILMDLSNTFRGASDFQVLSPGTGPNDLAKVRTGISWALAEFNAKLTENGLFVPHGQCSHVHLGGHVQTGGYGQLGRSFGLFGDHVEEFEMVTADGKIRIVNNSTDSELFYAVLGGSPGNYGVVCHLTLRVHRDADHPNSRGMRVAYPYNKHTLKNCLDIVVEIADNKELERDFDFCVTVLSASLDIFNVLPGLDESYKRHHEKEYGEDDLKGWPAAIIVYAQWANTGGPTQLYDDKVKAWFKKIKSVGSFITVPFFGSFDDSKSQKMSTLTGDWVFRDVREFLDPYEKRTYLTKSTKLVENQWSQWATDRIDLLQSNPLNDCRLSIQIQPFGGNKSMYYQNSINPPHGQTSYSWRDSSIVCVMDAFYSDRSQSVKEKAKQWALDWQHGNDTEGIGPNGKFSDEDRRVFWGSYGEFDLSKCWQFYYESEDKYEHLRHIKARVDPNGVFNPNPFAITPASPNETTMAAKLRSSHADRLDLNVALVNKSTASLSSVLGKRPPDSPGNGKSEKK